MAGLHDRQRRGALTFCHAAMAADFLIVVDAVRPAYARQAADACFEELDRLEAALSRFAPGSDVSRINAAPPGGMVRIGPDTMACLRAAEGVRVRTGGAFDVTLGAGGLVLDEAAMSAGGAVVDLGGIGKGYALDRMGELLREWSIGHALLSAGESTVLALGEWQVALRDPRDQQGSLGHVVLQDAALSGSGACVHGPHIIDPATGLAAQRHAAAWATAQTGALADALSTAFMVLDVPAVAACCSQREGTGALLIGTGAGSEPRQIPAVGSPFVLY